MKKNRIRILLLIVLFIALYACSKGPSPKKSTSDHRKPLSWGQTHRIFTYADDKAWAYGQLEIKKSLEREFFTTTNERLFEVERHDIHKIHTYYKFANLLFLCDVSSNKPVSKYVKEIIPEQVAAVNDTMPATMIAVKDLWARDQRVIFILGKDLEQLLLYTFENLNPIFDIYKEAEYKRLENNVYKLGLNEEEIAYEKEHYPWYLELPMQYRLFRRKVSGGFVSYLCRVKNYPDRFLAVYWEPMEDNQVSKEWLFDKRVMMGEKYYMGDTLYTKDVRQEKADFLGYQAYKLSGRWQNPGNFTGGAFACWGFYDETQKIAYMIDNSVFFPEGNKLRALIGLEIISKTFHTLNKN
ncbi:MAG TPA: DUF4837 family protein [Candidatus Cloacimonetes bacterium]|nr:DUF4837 family protein [Candidatus Cloacimonadota bacterium]